MKPLHRGCLMACAVLLLAGACNGDEGSLADDLSPTPAPTATPLPSVAPGATRVPVASESALAAIRRRGELRVGVLFNYPPFGQLTERGTLEGFEVDLVRALAEKWGVEVSFVQVTRQTAIPYLLSLRVDMLAAAVPHRREMHELVDFSQTIFRSGYLMLVPEDSPIEGMAGLDRQAVGIVEDDSFEVVAEQARDLSVTPNARQFATTEEAVEAMLEGRVAAVVGRREALMLATQTHPDVTILNEFLLVEPYAFAVRRGDANFRNLIDVTLQGLVDDGTYAGLFNQHFYGYAPDQLPVWPGEAIPTFDSQPDAMQVPAESKVARVARGETLTIVGLQLSYDDPDLDGQRLLDDFNRALINEMARRWRAAVNEVSSSGGEAGTALVAAGQADLAVGVLPRRDLSGGVDFSQSYLQRGLRLARLRDVSVDGIDDLSSRSAVVLGSAEDASLITDQNTNVELLDARSPQEALGLLQSRAAWVVLADEFTLGLMARQDPNIVVMDELFRPTPYAIAVPRYDSDFWALVNFTLQDMQVDGTLEQLVRQYFGPYAPPDEPARPLPIEVWPGSADYLGLTFSP